MIQAIHAADEIANIPRRSSRSNSPMPSGTTPIWRLTSTGLRGKIEPQASCMRPGSRRQQPGQHFDGGGFSRAVGPQKTKELPGRHLQIDAVHRGQARQTVASSFSVAMAMSGHACLPTEDSQKTTLARTRREPSAAANVAATIACARQTILRRNSFAKCGRSTATGGSFAGNAASTAGNSTRNTAPPSCEL